MVNKLSLDFEELENDFTHTPFRPEKSLRGDENKVKVNDEWYRVWSYSPFGITFLSSKPFTPGDEIKLILRLEKYNNDFLGTVVSCKQEERSDFFKVGLRTFYQSSRTNIEIDERETKRWTCPEQFLPVGTAPTPLKFNDVMFFRITDISHGGFKIMTSMRNKFIQRNMRFDASVTLPQVGSINTSFIVRYVDVEKIQDKEHIVAGVQFTDKEKVFHMSIAEYLLHFAEDVSISSLRKDGFKIKNYSKNLDFSYVKSRQEYKDVLKLRFNTYREAGKLSPELSIDNMVNEYDDKSRILMIKLRNQIIASARFMYFDSIQESYYANSCELNDNVPPVKDCLEIASVCISSENRGGDIFYHIFSHSILTAIKSNRRYILAGTSEALLKFYTDCGFVDTGIRYNSINLNNLEHCLIVMDTHSVAVRNNISLKRWCALYADVVDFMIEREYFMPNKKELFKIKSSKKLGRLFGYL